jgi:hypothetical protein
MTHQQLIAREINTCTLESHFFRKRKKRNLSFFINRAALPAEPNSSRSRELPEEGPGEEAR